MSDRPTGEQVAALQQAVIDFRNPDHIPSSAGWWLGKAVDALLAERARWEAEERQKVRLIVQCADYLGRAEAAEAELAELKQLRHGDPAMFGAVFGFELGEAEGQDERTRLRHLVEVLRQSRQLWRRRHELCEMQSRLATGLLAEQVWGLMQQQEAGEAKLSAVRELVDSEDQSRDIVDQIRVLLDGQEKPTDV